MSPRAKRAVQEDAPAVPEDASASEAGATSNGSRQTRRDYVVLEQVAPDADISEALREGTVFAVIGSAAAANDKRAIGQVAGERAGTFVASTRWTPRRTRVETVTKTRRHFD